jgi:hypothetical protein
MIRVMTYLAEGVEYVVEVDQDLTLGYLCDVVHGLARIVADPGILVGEAGKHWRDNGFKVLRQFLKKSVLACASWVTQAQIQSETRPMGGKLDAEEENNE